MAAEAPPQLPTRDRSRMNERAFPGHPAQGDTVHDPVGVGNATHDAPNFFHSGRFGRGFLDRLANVRVVGRHRRPANDASITSPADHRAAARRRDELLRGPFNHHDAAAHRAEPRDVQGKEHRARPHGLSDGILTDAAAVIATLKAREPQDPPHSDAEQLPQRHAGPRMIDHHATTVFVDVRTGAVTGIVEEAVRVVDFGDAAPTADGETAEHADTATPLPRRGEATGFRPSELPRGPQLSAEDTARLLAFVAPEGSSVAATRTPAETAGATNVGSSVRTEDAATAHEPRQAPEAETQKVGPWRARFNRVGEVFSHAVRRNRHTPQHAAPQHTS